MEGERGNEEREDGGVTGWEMKERPGNWERKEEEEKTGKKGEMAREDRPGARDRMGESWGGDEGGVRGKSGGTNERKLEVQVREGRGGREVRGRGETAREQGGELGEEEERSGRSRAWGKDGGEGREEPGREDARKQAGTGREQGKAG